MMPPPDSRLSRLLSDVEKIGDEQDGLIRTVNDIKLSAVMSRQEVSEKLTRLQVEVEYLKSVVFWAATAIAGGTAVAAVAVWKAVFAP